MAVKPSLLKRTLFCVAGLLAALQSTNEDMRETEPESTAVTDAQLQDEARHWLVRLTSGQATTADADEFRRWCVRSAAHRQAFAQARQLWQTLGPAAQQVTGNDLPGNIVPMPERRFGRRAFLTGAVAASAAVVLIGPTILDEVAGHLADYHTGVGEQRSVTLARDTTLELNTQTRINRQVFDDGSQGIELVDGEVEVLTQARFRMRAGAGWVSSHDGTFVVRATGPQVLVTCVAGQLRVEHRGDSLQLNPGQQLSYGERTHSQPVAVDTSVVTAWRQGLLVFEDETLAYVIDELNRYHADRIVLMNKELGQRRVQARFSFHQLSDVAALIRDAYGAKVMKLPGVVLVS